MTRPIGDTAGRWDPDGWSVYFPANIIKPKMRNYRGADVPTSGRSAAPSRPRASDLRLPPAE